MLHGIPHHAPLSDLALADLELWLDQHHRLPALG